MEKFFSIFKFWAVFITGIAIGGCETHDLKDDFGLDVVVEMEMTSEEMSIIDTGAYTKTPVNIPIRINGEKMIGQVSFAGATQIDALKRSFEVLILSSADNNQPVYRLSAMNGDMSALRAMTSFRAFSGLGFNTPMIKPAALWINDDFAGLYLLMSRYDKTYFESRNITSARVYQAENGVGNFSASTNLERGFSVKVGPVSRGDLAKVSALVAAQPTEENCRELETIVNIDNVFQYMAISSLFDNKDGIDNNYYLLRTESDSRLQIMPWDLDLTFKETHSIADGDIFAQNALFQRLFFDGSHVRSYTEVYNETKKQLKTLDLKEYVREYADSIRDAYEADWFLSGGKQTLDDHVVEISYYLDTVLSE